MKDLIRFCTSGSVDDGKSTLLGRLLYETGNVYNDQFNNINKNNEIDFSLLLDGLESEREQGITIDVAYRYFETNNRRFIIADTPGHVQYTRNMVTGSSNSDAAIVLIDARYGFIEQSKRHTFINSLLDVPYIIFAINKMDLVNYDQNIFEKIKKSVHDFTENLNFKNIFTVPVSAKRGDNICYKTKNMNWFNGSTILDILQYDISQAKQNKIDFRFPVQIVLKPDNSLRGYAGTIASGSIRQNEEVKILPSGFKTNIVSIKNIDNKEVKEATVGEPVVLSLKNEIDISRGNMIVRPDNIPMISNKFQSTICWFSEKEFTPKKYILKSNTNKVHAFVKNIHYKININNLHRENSDVISINDIFKATIETTGNIFFDFYIQNKTTGSFILIDPDTNDTVACGMIKSNKKHLSGEAKSSFMGSKGIVFWLTGLSGSGKSTIAESLHKRINSKTIILDGDHIRKGLCKDLGFSKEDRLENIRRVAEVCKILSDQGINVITSFISPTKECRRLAAEIIGDTYKEIYLDCSLEVCEKRDPKGLYKKVREGQINNFTGIDSIYEIPESPCLSIKTDLFSVNKCVDKIILYINKGTF